MLFHSQAQRHTSGLSVKFGVEVSSWHITQFYLCIIRNRTPGTIHEHKNLKRIKNTLTIS